MRTQFEAMATEELHAAIMAKKKRKVSDEAGGAKSVPVCKPKMVG